MTPLTIPGTGQTVVSNASPPIFFGQMLHLLITSVIRPSPSVISYSPPNSSSSAIIPIKSFTGVSLVTRPFTRRSLPISMPMYDANRLVCSWLDLPNSSPIAAPRPMNVRCRYSILLFIESSLYLVRGWTGGYISFCRLWSCWSIWRSGSDLYVF